MPYVKQKHKTLNSTALISVSFLAVIIVGTILLIMPFSSADGKFTDPMTAFFTAVSATCVTGIVTVDTGSYWSIFGQIVILAMIQTGGLGLVTLVSFFNFMLRKKTELSSMHLASASVNASSVGNIKQIIKVTVVVSVICEFIGGVLLMISYVPKFGVKGIYIAFFTSIASFCNAGFDVMGMVAEPFSGLTALSDDPLTLLVIPFLVIMGGQGFFLWYDIIEYKNRKKFSFQSKLVLFCSAALTLLGTLTTMLCEWNNPQTLGGKSFLMKIANSFFNATALRSSGFNTMDTAALTPMSKLLEPLYMFIGAAPSSTGGGVKITTFAIIIMTVICVMRNKSDTVISGRKIKKSLVYEAFSIVFIVVCIIILCSVTIAFTSENIKGINVFFDITSAITTTGLSTGIISELAMPQKILMHILMFIGRVGPVSLALSLSMKDSPKDRNEVYPEGKLMVG